MAEFDDADQNAPIETHLRLVGIDGGGRRPAKGAPIAREAIAEAFVRRGGVDRLIEWIGEDPQNEKAFYLQIYPKLLPLQLDAGKRLAKALQWKPPT